MIGKAITNNEEKMVKELRKNPKKLWENISILRGECSQEKKIILYNRDGTEMNKDEQPRELLGYWPQFTDVEKTK